jgi:hypothetical protein
MRNTLWKYRVITWGVVYFDGYSHLLYRRIDRKYLQKEQPCLQMNLNHLSPFMNRSLL